MRCDIPLNGPSALHSALAEDGLLEEHIKVRHPEAQQVFATPAFPVLTAEEIRAWAATIDSCGPAWANGEEERDAAILFSRRVVATFAAKDRVIAELTAKTATQCDVIRDVKASAGDLESKLQAANRRASDLFDELGATQNAAQAERVALESKLHNVAAVLSNERQSEESFYAWVADCWGAGYVPHQIGFIKSAWFAALDKLHAALQDAKEPKAAQSGDLTPDECQNKRPCAEHPENASVGEGNRP